MYVCLFTIILSLKKTLYNGVVHIIYGEHGFDSACLYGRIHMVPIALAIIGFLAQKGSQWPGLSPYSRRQIPFI